MKKLGTILFAFVFTVSLSQCSQLKKAKSKVSASDVKKIADMIDFDFGDGPNGPFEVKKTKYRNPKLIIENRTDRTIKVIASGPVKKTFVVAKNGMKKAIIKSGGYHFKATAKGTKGCEGDVKLKEFNEYKWVFVIRK